MSRPMWVELGLWGISSRAVALAFMWFSYLVAIAGIAYGFHDPVFFAAAAFILAGLWYRSCIRWMDAHDAWTE